MARRLVVISLILLLWLAPVGRHLVAQPSRSMRPAPGPGDWPTYNCDVQGWRHNAGETSLSRANVGRLQEKWRFPPQGTDFQIGAIHATPVVVNGCVYFGTANEPAFYKLDPAGRLLWSCRLAKRGSSARDGAGIGVFGSALVTEDAVFFATLAGFVYALERETGKEKWHLDLRSNAFPDAHDLNGVFASPILANGKIVVAGGAREQPAILPNYTGYTGRGFVVALEPDSGRIVWKYDVGPKPQRLVPPVKIHDAWGVHVFHYGPASSLVWSTPSYHAGSQTLFFGTDTNNAPRQPTLDNPRLDNRYASAVIALDARNGCEKWVTQINPGDFWNRSMRAYDPRTGRYMDQAVGDTPRVFTILWNGTLTLVIGFGCKNGGFYIVRVSDGVILAHTPLYQGPPTYPLSPPPDKRTLALPGAIGGLQTGCATDGKRIFTNGIDAIRLGTQETKLSSRNPPTGGRVAALSLDTKTEYWRHERPGVVATRGLLPWSADTCTGDPVASGIASANGVLYFTTLVSSKLVALDAPTGALLREINLPPVWSGPAVSRGRVYVGTGSVVLPALDFFVPRQSTGTLFCFGLPDETEPDRGYK